MKKQLLSTFFAVIGLVNLSVYGQCVAPTLLNVSSVTTNSANFSWTKGTITDTKWEILLVPNDSATSPTEIPLNPTFPNQILQTIETPQTSPFQINGLEPAQIYFYYIRTICSETSFSIWAGPYYFNTQTCDAVNKCNYKFLLTNSVGNSWNGGRIKVMQNGILIQTLGSNGINNATGVTVALCPDESVQLYWNIAGTTPGNIGMTMISPFNDILYSKPAGVGSPLTMLYNQPGNCTPPSCSKPLPLAVLPANINTTSASLSWTEQGTATQWEVFVTTFGSAPPTNGSALTATSDLPTAGDGGFYYLANTNLCTAANLLPATAYQFYVRAICASNEISNWTILNPIKFITKPLNDECSGAIVVPINIDSNCVQYVLGNTFGASRTLPNTFPTCGGGNDDDVWFSFQAISTTHIIKINNIAGTTNDIDHTLYSGNDCGNFTQLYCSNPNTSIATNLIPGNIYKIRVYTATNNISQSATFEVCITTPPPITNDNCETAMQVSVNDGLICTLTSTASITGATASNQGVNTCSGSPDDDVWFSFVANSVTQIIDLLNIQGTTVDLNYSVYAGICNNLTLMYCSDVNQSTNSNYTIGQTYYVRVWSASSLLEDISFNLCIGKILPPINVINLPLTDQQLVTDILVNNPCVAISNVTSSTGINFGLATNGIGYFNNNSNDFPVTSGIILSTGNASLSSGPNLTTLSDGNQNWTGDTELESIVFTATGTPMASFNATKLEFDFTSLNEYMSFNFLFASEEYGTFQCAYSDSFAFLLTDIATGITTNLAVVPNTSIPISVVTIRNQTYNPNCTSENPDYFGAFYGTEGLNSLGAPINFNGLTNLMTASATIIPNHNYHIKLVIADRQDSLFDSAVFIQGGSFAAGPPQCLDKIQLVAFVDENTNGVKDNNENSFTYGSFTYQKNNIGETSNVNSPLGFYNIYDENPLNTYDFNYQIDSEYLPYYTLGTTNYNDLTIVLGSGTQTIYFPLTLTQGYTDVTVSTIPIGQPRPGFSYMNKVIYKNLGVTAASGTINFTKPALTTILNVSQSGTTITAEGFSYNFTNLAPYETRTFDVTFSVPAIPTVNIDDVLSNTISISAPENDINLNNNIFENTQIVVAAYDPNDKLEAHGEKINFNTFAQNDYLYYTIRFQNTGTANAINVRIEDLLDAQLDAASIRMIGASHNYVMERIDNKIVWKFDYIQLPGAVQNALLSQGYVSFKIKLNPGFEVGDLIPNSAEIYFDTNPAIVTNTFVTEFQLPLSASTFSQENIILFPNPARNLVQINLQNSNEQIKSLIVYDLLGKEVKTTSLINDQVGTINVSNLAKGVYVVEIITENKFKLVKKLVIE